MEAAAADRSFAHGRCSSGSALPHCDLSLTPQLRQLPRLRRLQPSALRSSLITPPTQAAAAVMGQTRRPSRLDHSNRGSARLLQQLPLPLPAFLRLLHPLPQFPLCHPLRPLPPLLPPLFLWCLAGLVLCPSTPLRAPTDWTTQVAPLRPPVPVRRDRRAAAEERRCDTRSKD